jgi:Spy/CpxP family protein refolding chaperone
VLPQFVVESLNLTADQKKQLEALQKDVDARLAKILTAEQKKQLEEMGPGRGGPGGRGPGGRGPGGPGGPGGDRPPQ